MKCLLCSSEKSVVFEEVSSFGYPLVYFRCRQCGMIFQSAEDAQAADPDFYAETYREIYQGDPEPTAKDLFVQKSRAEFLIRFLTQNHISAPARILDIGASSGMLLSAFRTAFGGQAVGVEPGEAYRAYAESQGLEMYPSLDALAASGTERFDLISMMHVLEHLPDPVEILGRIRQDLLSEGGRLVVEVPNFYAHDSYELAHLACYTPHTLKQTLKQAGFRVEKLKQHGEPRSGLLKLYLLALAVPEVKGTRAVRVKPECCVRLHRRSAMFYRRIVQKLFPHQAWYPLPEDKVK